VPVQKASVVVVGEAPLGVSCRKTFSVTRGAPSEGAGAAGFIHLSALEGRHWRPGAYSGSERNVPHNETAFAAFETTGSFPPNANHVPPALGSPE
jgi:hypothetical protein